MAERLSATPDMRREPIASTRACSTASKTARAACASGASRRWMPASWQASLSAIESAWPRTIETSCRLSLRGGSGRRALSDIRIGRSEAKVTSRSGFLAIARRHAAIERFSGSVGASFLSPGLRFEMDTRFSLRSVGYELAVHDRVPVIGAGHRERFHVDLHLAGGSHAPKPETVFDGFGESRFQTRILAQLLRRPQSLFLDGEAPASVAALGLMIPFKHVHQEHFERALKLVVLLRPHVRQLLGDVQHRSDRGARRAGDPPAPKPRCRGHPRSASASPAWSCRWRAVPSRPGPPCCPPCLSSAPR